jgi:hypothetical protein
MSTVLTRHLEKRFRNIKPCDEWTAEELQEYQARLFYLMHSDLDRVYNASSDNRRLRFASLDEHREHWSRMNELVKENPHMSEMHRDGHCHEAVMWLVHHIPWMVAPADSPVPLLSTTNHRRLAAESSIASASRLQEDYREKSACAYCHIWPAPQSTGGSSDALPAAGKAAMEPPDMPQAWIHEGYQVNARPQPPWSSLMPEPPYATSRMEAYYDWSKHAMREVYHDLCVPIFLAGSNWACDFLNVNGVAYLIQHKDRAKGQPACCIFRKPWSPPAPNFLKHSGFPYLSNTTYGEERVHWWQSTDVPIDVGGPFGYGYTEDPATGELTPRAFYFGGLWNFANGSIGVANTVQYFDDFRAEVPPASVFDVPEACESAAQCTNFPPSEAGDAPTRGLLRPSHAAAALAI